MRYSESDLPRTEEASATEERLRRENEELRRQLQQLRAASHTSTRCPRKTVASIAAHHLGARPFGPSVSGDCVLRRISAIASPHFGHCGRSPRARTGSAACGGGYGEAIFSREHFAIAGKYPGNDRGTHTCARGWICEAAPGRYRRPRPGRPNSLRSLKRPN